MAKKEYPIRMDLQDVERRTAERDAAKRRAERQRQDMGSAEDILGRAERNQAREAEEERQMRRSRRNGNAKGGKVKMAKGGGIEKRGKTKGMMPKMAGGKGYAKGGSVDGCAVRGKTRAPMRGK